MTEQEERADLWRTITKDAKVPWCDGRGCTAGSFAQHENGFASATKVHLSVPPDPEDRTAFHRAVRLVGKVAAMRKGGTPREQARSAFDFATETMRAHDVPVPRDVLATRPETAAEIAERRVGDEGTRASEKAGEREPVPESPEPETTSEKA